ncbi:hypothetical protein M0R45_030911 [Rubus argutus]|uniref:BED-type domain-containing protein n=1 Tax=Rubus argutus TaxID=59490 RepID=A0AAW1WCI8_RUBAR
MEPSYVGGNESQALDNENEMESTSKDCSSGRTRKKTSSIWEHFSQQAEDGKYICNYCSRGIIGGGRNGTNGLIGHHKSCPELKKKIRKGNGSSFASVKVGEYGFDELDARRKLANMIVKHEYPLSIVDHDGFKSFCHSLQPLFRVVSRNTIKRDIFKIFEYEKERTMNLLSTNSSRIAITTDMWTANNQKRGFMAVTAHFIDDFWSLNSRLVRFIYVPSAGISSKADYTFDDDFDLEEATRENITLYD